MTKEKLHFKDLIKEMIFLATPPTTLLFNDSDNSIFFQNLNFSEKCLKQGVTAPPADLTECLENTAKLRHCNQYRTF